MRKLIIGAALAMLAVGSTGCGHSPSTPSSPTVSTPATQAAVGAAVNQAVSQVAMSAPMSGDVVHSMTFPCPDGGSIVSTYSAALPTGPGSTLTTTSKMEFNACKSQSVIMNGDPYLLSSGEHVMGPIVDNVLSSMASTMRITGGLRFDANGVQGRAQYNCTQVMTIQFSGNGPPQITMTSSGTITWEQPLGTVTTRPCGPA
jgi:hypothetical protein